MARIDHEGMRLENELQIKREEVISTGRVDQAIAASRADAVRAADVPADGVYRLIDRMLEGGWISRFFGGLCAFLMAQTFVVVKMIRPAAFIFFSFLFYTVWQDVIEQ